MDISPKRTSQMWFAHFPGISPKAIGSAHESEHVFLLPLIFMCLCFKPIHMLKLLIMCLDGKSRPNYRHTWLQLNQLREVCLLFFFMWSYLINFDNASPPFTTCSGCLNCRCHLLAAESPIQVATQGRPLQLAWPWALRLSAWQPRSEKSLGDEPIKKSIRSIMLIINTINYYLRWSA